MIKGYTQEELESMDSKFLAELAMYVQKHDAERCGYQFERARDIKD
jgi:hypothetical protein